MVAPAMADAIPVPRMMPNGTNQHRSERRGSSDEIEEDRDLFGQQANPRYDRPLNRHPPDGRLVEAEIARFGGRWQCQFLDPEASKASLA
jgi:hypothetical protein